jgi:chromosome segregation ATPase
MSDYFAARNESMVVGDTIQEFIKKLLAENQQLEEENRELERRNQECEQQIQNGDMEGLDRDGIVDQWGHRISDYEIRSKKMRKEENLIQQREKLFERDNQDLLEYVKWISADLSMLRDRARIAEKIISDLKKSGEESVDSLMSNLTAFKHKQDELDREVDSFRAVINAKENEVALKEGNITNLKRQIELETKEKEMEIRRLKTEIDEQNKVIENQLKIIKELQTLNDYTQADLIQATSELQSRIREKNDLQMKFLDSDHETTNLLYRQNTLEE